MRKPFVLRVLADDPDHAKRIAKALIEPLRERGARVLVDGVAHGGGSTCGVHVLTGPRGLPGASLRIGVWDENEGARWLAPLDVPSDPEMASRAVMGFLEGWGFIGAPILRATPRPSHT